MGLDRILLICPSGKIRLKLQEIFSPPFLGIANGMALCAVTGSIRIPLQASADAHHGSERTVATLVKANCHCARSRHQQRKAIDLELPFKIAAEKAKPFVLRLVSEPFALGRTLVSGAGLPECRKRRIPWKRQRSHLQDANDRANQPT